MHHTPLDRDKSVEAVLLSAVVQRHSRRILLELPVLLLSLAQELLFEAPRLVQLGLLLALDVALEDPQDLDLSQGWLGVVEVSEHIRT